MQFTLSADTRKNIKYISVNDMLTNLNLYLRNQIKLPKSSAKEL